MHHVKVNVCTASARLKHKLRTSSVSCTSLRARRLANVTNCVENFFAQSFQRRRPGARSRRNLWIRPVSRDARCDRSNTTAWLCLHFMKRSRADQKVIQVCQCCTVWVALRLHRGVLYFPRVIRFRGTRANIISFIPWRGVETSLLRRHN